MNFARGSNNCDFLPSPKMPHEIKSTGIQSARGLLLPWLSYQFLPKALPRLRGVATAQKQDAKGLPKNAVPQRLAGPSRLRPATPHPTPLAWLQKPLILLDRNGHPNPIGHGARQLARNCPRHNCIADWSALRKPSSKTTRKIAPIGVSMMQRRSSNPTTTRQHSGRVQISQCARCGAAGRKET